MERITLFRLHDPGVKTRHVHPSPGTYRRRRSARHAAPLLSLLAAVVAMMLAGLWQTPAAVASLRPASTTIDELQLLLPVGGGVTRPFEQPEHRYASGHRGVDLAAPEGSTVRAAAAGTVGFLGRVAGRPVLVVEHGNGIQTTYEPVIASVTSGDKVQAGQALGVLASGGGHSGSLHWGLKEKGDYLDPMLHLAPSQAGGATAPGPVRLLPLKAEPRPLVAALPPDLGLPGQGGLPSPSAIGGGIPVSGPITSPYGMRLHPVLKVWKLHDGVDYGAPCGAPIRSVSAGRVVLVENHVAYGKRVIVDAGGGTRYGYTHLSTFGVSTGQQVAAGSYLGSVGSTGYSTGCHLHFMAWRNGQVVPPPR
ncbi:peptidoglycan DD-metalloendopeptidase family protein [Aestuariimicrobium sp. p3-SID1156]|uniref:peptidoglycan DD-metalloendopeptidase family protein n=1 Tax=Aestuariimicrobium sp. p3-SID1156 TaxID=2916038 RepID=UPI00223A68EE|nr:peptidoglycan DD-metalloendopeptidase family protein [Aestuariimicrobium sp. p3-SID1156]MCT1459696.1 peptidoglycan DD-metalloendopeptidase family protein [Aestuariimicrobium sp. p3-SID1156]